LQELARGLALGDVAIYPVSALKNTGISKLTEFMESRL
jgi:hypothetical protein